MQEFRDDVVSFLHKDIDSPLVATFLTTPKDVSHGDFALPVFPLAKAAGKNPMEYASELADIFSKKIEKGDIVAKVESAGPYINITLDFAHVAKVILALVHEKRKHYGSNSSIEKTYVMDFSAPNIAKPFGIGHLRSTVLGNANANILRFLGAKVIGINYIGDWGTQFGKVIWAYKNWGDDAKLQASPIEYLLELYVKFHEAPTEEMENEARTIFAELEKGNEEYTKLWTQFRDLSLINFDKTYSLMNVVFDEVRGEAYYNDKMQATIDLLKEKKLLEESEGAQIIDFEKHDPNSKLPPLIIVKSDGGSTYALRDLAAAQDRISDFAADELLYEVGSEQQLHFQQVFATLKLLGFTWANNCHHLGHGLYRLPEGKMSTRKGRIVLMEDVLYGAIDRVKSIITERNPELASSDSFEDVAKAVGVGAVLFFDMKHDRVKDIEFDWDRVLDFQGETGPYVQYTHARICSILRKSQAEGFAKITSAIDETKLDTVEDRELVVKLSEFESALVQCSKNYKPHVLCRYLLDLSQLVNGYYGKHKVLTEDPEIVLARVYLLDAVRQVLANGLILLGITPVDEM